MASSSTSPGQRLISDAANLLWGENLKDEVFSRWTQGFVFSEDEPTALIQHEGGPCAVIAPVQTYLLRHCLFSESPTPDLQTTSAAEVQRYLADALVDILTQISAEKFILVDMVTEEDGESSTLETEDNQKKQEGETTAKKARLDQEHYHSSLRCKDCDNADDLKVEIKTRLASYGKQFGVLSFLYSVVLTKGVEQIKNEVEDPGEALIDGIHGHGSQSLINLLLTGKAVSNVWDNDKDISGMKLRGICKQSKIGFLSMLEHYRYCEVGWYLKNPMYPIWLLGSETHLTALFSKEKRLVVQETQQQVARRIFQNFDKDSNGFIESTQLGPLMEALDLVSEKEYVDLMRTKLDPEHLGIITMNSFLEEFFPGQMVPETPRHFILFHYNGLRRSCFNNKVVYQQAEVTLEEEPEVQFITDTSPIKCCLQTKWPTIDIKWTNSHTPSIN
ncbi:LOW QUALITY PROTEIN: ubiquitin carboxyl-terminal hydrolase MINDY-3-like [Liolophura sinensis]|uniref:LOW QUALITY PROTEIN: ubiquitin carboxyl-terminal hydrolase MINDY-3-like n=1 Tax=Liolophura sinensis TaxID=3198878 RepID=UPI003158DE8F